jgi:hypothetical protein
VADKFPDRLPALCEEFSKFAAPDVSPGWLASALAYSSLSKPTRIQVLSDFAQRGTLEHKVSFLRELAGLDVDRGTRLLMPLLRTLPIDTTGEYCQSWAANLTFLVIGLENEAVWREFLRAAKRSSVGLRMEMMSQMSGFWDRRTGRTPSRAFRLAFLVAFLDDAAVRVIPRDPSDGKFAGPCAGFSIPRLQVRDYAAMVIASILKLKESPDEFWTEAQWQSLRDKVRRKLAEEKLPRL